MPINIEFYKKLNAELQQKSVQLVAVSKLKSVADIVELHQAGQKDFGENYVQELVEKYDATKQYQINWHFIGHLQSNKVKYIAPFIHLIQSVDSLKLLQEINKQAAKNNRVINCLLQVYIATEETKFGLNETELDEVFEEANKGNLPNVSIKGFMGMASFSSDEILVGKEFEQLMQMRTKHKIAHPILSFGMSQDYKIAIQQGSNMVRIGSLLFGQR